MIIANIADFREAARRRLPHFLFEYIDGGAYAEVTLRRNIQDLEAISLRQRVLRDISDIDTSTELFGQRVAMPVVLAPVGIAGLNARRGECQAVRAAQRAGVPFTLSTVSACSLAEVRAAAKAPFWFQLYMIRDRPFMRDLLAQAAQAGCTALVFTVDLPIPGTRYRDQRSGLAGAPGLTGRLRRLGQVLMRPGWAWDVGVRGRPHALGNIAPLLKGSSGIEDFMAWMSANFDPGIRWNDLDFIRSEWKGPLIIKGILDPEDAVLAAKSGADALIVSNHGGRQLDGAISSIAALPPIVREVGGKIEIHMDGGIRSGQDVLKARALGARGVYIGRAFLYGLGAMGEHGVSEALRCIRNELDITMAFCGLRDIEKVDGNILAENPFAVAPGKKR